VGGGGEFATLYGKVNLIEVCSASTNEKGNGEKKGRLAAFTKECQVLGRGLVRGSRKIPPGARECERREC